MTESHCLICGFLRVYTTKERAARSIAEHLKRATNPTDYQHQGAATESTLRAEICWMPPAKSVTPQKKPFKGKRAA